MNEFELVNAFLGEASELFETSQTMEAIFLTIMKRNEKNIAVEFFDDKGKLQDYSYAKMRSNCYGISSALSSFLCQKPKHVPVILKLQNSPKWMEIFWAILMSGYKPLLIDAKTSKEGTENLAKQSKAVAIISDDVFTYDTLKISTEDLLKEKHSYSFAPDWENEIIFCSSGTTGDIKLMVYNGENIVNQICCSLDIPKETLDIMYPTKMGKVKILAMVPFHHIFGFVAIFLWYTFYGKTIVFPTSNTPSEIQNICQKAGVTHIYSVPLFWDSLALQISRKIALMGNKYSDTLDAIIGYNTKRITKGQMKDASKLNIGDIQKLLLGKDVKFCISGGGFLSKETLTVINGLGYPLYNGYGMTELGVTSVELSSSVEIRLKGSIGKPFHGVEYKILSTTAKNINYGELLVRSKAMHIKEIINGEERDAQLDEEGFFKTGDIAEKDATGRYFIKGRIKDIIINSDGENIFPDELELYFKELPNVNHLSVLGIKDKSSQNEKIVLVLELDNKVTSEDVKQLNNLVNDIAKDLPHKVTISDIYLAKNKLPLANNMKVKRYLIKKSIEEKTNEYISISKKKVAKSFDGFDQKTIEDILLPTRKIFSEVLILPEFKIEDDSHWINDLGGDSMNYIEMVQKLQEFFGVTINEEKLGQLTCINDFVLEIATLLKDFNK